MRTFANSLGEALNEIIMVNERKTERLVRNILTNKGYFEDENIIIEEQRSDSPLIDKLLLNASKRAERAIQNLSFVQMIIPILIVIECKADIKKHESANLDKYSDFAVDGVCLYSSFYQKNLMYWQLR